ncbi:MAG: hypothetical protein ABJA98_10465 [Acidobacteriota bacterium]
MGINTRAESSHDWCEAAQANLRRAINLERRFPSNVFLGSWSDFYFFDADWMRVADAVEHVKALLDVEGGRCACLWKLDSENPSEPRFFYVRRETSVDEYGALLAGKTAGYGWLDALERLACASDAGDWCIYCEPNSEIAVIGFQQVDAAHRYASALARVHAMRFEDATQEPPLSYSFSERALSREWREAFLREYAARSL